MVLPTILTNVADSMKVVCEEVFGPVSVVEPFTSLDEVIEKANEGPYGLDLVASGACSPCIHAVACHACHMSERILSKVPLALGPSQPHVEPAC